VVRGVTQKAQFRCRIFRQIRIYSTVLYIRKGFVDNGLRHDVQFEEIQTLKKRGAKQWTTENVVDVFFTDSLFLYIFSLSISKKYCNCLPVLRYT
jgi:hypothetical protein